LLDRLEALIVYFIENSSSLLGRIDLIKRLYLFEYYHTLACGEQYTNAVFERYRHGPYCAAAINTARNMDGIINEDSYVGVYGVGYTYRISPSYRVSDDLLPVKQKTLADFVVNVLKEKSLDETLKFVYSTPPMVKVLLQEQEDEMPHYREVLNMSARKPTPKFTREELQAARERNRLRKKRGTDNDYFAHLTEENRSLEPFRRRANECLSILK